MYKTDEIDMRILEMLKKDARASYSEIAENVHLSRVAVRERIKLMQKEGIILGFTVQINSKAYNKPVSVYFDVEVVPHELFNVAKKLVLNEEIAVVSQHTGTTGLHIHAFIDKIENLSQFMDEHLYSVSGVRNVHAHVLIKNYKTNAYLC